MDCHEKRQRFAYPLILLHAKSYEAYAQVEFSGTLLGFDDYVSKCDVSQ
jgi:hypothetical protein